MKSARWRRFNGHGTAASVRITRQNKPVVYKTLKIQYQTINHQELSSNKVNYSRVVSKTRCTTTRTTNQMIFKIGHRVVCVNTKPIAPNPYNTCLKKLKEGEIYTVIGTLGGGLQLKEVKSLHPLGGFNQSRFRPIDYSWIEELLEIKFELVEAEELVPVT